MTALKTLFIITVSTSRFVFPGVPAAVNLPETAKQPAVKSLTAEIASSVGAPSGATASLIVPDGLKTASELRLQITDSLPKPSEDAPAPALVEYWGCGRQIGADQPRITRPAPRAAPPREIPDKSYAYWPPPNSVPLDDAAELPGTYTFKTNYCGGAQVTLTKDQNFLDPIDITTAGEFDLEKPMTIRWKPVPNAVGYLLRAYSGDTTRTVTWTSSVKPELAAGIEYCPVTKSDLENYIKQGVLLPSYVVTCTIPAGVFKGCEGVILVMTAVGRDVRQQDNDAEAWVVIRSTASLPLHSAPLRGLKPVGPKSADRFNQDGE